MILRDGNVIYLKKTGQDDKSLLYRLNQNYLKEMNRYYHDPENADGSISYGYFDDYFTAPERLPLLICMRNRAVGFALINSFSYFEDEKTDFVMGEFCIRPEFRKKGLGREAVRMILGKHHGKWEVKYHEDNLAALRFWGELTQIYHPEKRKASEKETVLVFFVK